MSRSSKKWIPANYDFLKNILNLKKGSGKFISAPRNHPILPQCIGLRFGVYNGRKSIPILVNEEMVGSKFGEFAATRIYRPRVDKTAIRKKK